MTTTSSRNDPVLVDDQLLGRLLRGETPTALEERDVYTTGYWYVRLCQAVLTATGRPGVPSGPLAALHGDLRRQAVAGVLELPAGIGLISLRTLAPQIGVLR